jgi:hypothetical protein
VAKKGKRRKFWCRNCHSDVPWPAARKHQADHFNAKTNTRERK